VNVAAGAVATGGGVAAGVADAAEGTVGPEVTLAAAIPKSESTLDTGIPRASAISDGLRPCVIRWLTCAASEIATVSSDGCGWGACAIADRTGVSV
jgi:hypothetical protein